MYSLKNTVFMPITQNRFNFSHKKSLSGSHRAKKINKISIVLLQRVKARTLCVSSGRKAEFYVLFVD